MFKAFSTSVACPSSSFRHSEVMSNICGTAYVCKLPSRPVDQCISQSMCVAATTLYSSLGSSLGRTPLPMVMGGCQYLRVPAYTLTTSFCWSPTSSSHLKQASNEQSAAWHPPYNTVTALKSISSTFEGTLARREMLNRNIANLYVVDVHCFCM